MQRLSSSRTIQKVHIRSKCTTYLLTSKQNPENKSTGMFIKAAVTNKFLGYGLVETKTELDKRIVR